MLGEDNARVSRCKEHGRVKNRWIPLVWHPACCNDLFRVPSFYLATAREHSISFRLQRKISLLVVRHELVEQKRTGTRTVTPDNLLFCHGVPAS